jgi:hypothetical protein
MWGGSAAEKHGSQDMKKVRVGRYYEVGWYREFGWGTGGAWVPPPLIGLKSKYSRPSRHLLMDAYMEAGLRPSRLDRGHVIADFGSLDFTVISSTALH